ncbi:MAG: nucleotide sugar dehydrogenase [Proteobacteria bacterium]|nr:nucleotide sugar dehydrogenase [Pseudomonadota bacterium]MBU1418420.1 nucleotide sugar dehydrogenase [Pseudomonadota bacterium]MBU1455322.1 nucleotide sugar dehydrogenase [Pseudomonadota bacterium]
MSVTILDLLKEKIALKTVTVGVVGLGYVGLPLSLTFLRKGVRVTGFDLDLEKVKKLGKGESYIKHIGNEDLSAFVQEGVFQATADFDRLQEPDVLIICVPTPLTSNREPDLKYVVATGEAIGRVLRPGQLIVLESTTYPGTTTEVLQPILEKNGLRAGRDFGLAFSPEREDPGNPDFTTATIPKVVGGVDSLSSELATAFYEIGMKQVVTVSSAEVAEMSKLLENIFRSVNIALVNELKTLCLRMGIDVWEVIAAAGTKPFGYMTFYPGPGLGGHCIPIDPFYLTSKAREYDVPTRFIELAGEINTSMPYFVVQRVMEALNEQGKSLKGARLLILGAAYKKDVDDDRESPSYKLMELLSEKGAEVAYNDHHIPVLQQTRKYNFSLTSTPITEENLQAADCILIATNHSYYDYPFILKHAKLIVDTRNVFSGLPDPDNKVFMA